MGKIQLLITIDPTKLGITDISEDICEESYEMLQNESVVDALCRNYKDKPITLKQLDDFLYAEYQARCE